MTSYTGLVNSVKGEVICMTSYTGLVNSVKEGGDLYDILHRIG